MRKQDLGELWDTLQKPMKQNSMRRKQAEKNEVGRKCTVLQRFIYTTPLGNGLFHMVSFPDNWILNAEACFPFNLL